MVTLLLKLQKLDKFILTADELRIICFESLLFIDMVDLGKEKQIIYQISKSNMLN